MPERPLDEIGLGGSARAVIYAISILPFVGFVIGGSYMARRSAATRRLGWRLILYTVFIHALYLTCVCPAAMIWALAQ